MKFVIRDDDLNYFSKPSDIERWYADIFSIGIPVGFATIPFVKGTSDVHVVDNGDREYPISTNKGLMDYLRDNPMIEIIQHGCTHETWDGIYEYAQKEGLFEDTKRGKDELERAWGKEIKVFAPPHDWISAHGARAVEKAGMNIIRGRGLGLRNFVLEPRYIINFINMFIYRFPRYISTRPKVYPYVLDFGRHKEVTSYRLEDKDILEGLDYVNKKNGNFVVVVHLHNFDDSKKKLLLDLIMKAREYKAEFVKPSELF